MTLCSGMVSGAKHHYHWPRVPQQYLTILPDFIGWYLICTNAVSTQMQLQTCFGSFFFKYSLFSAGESPSLVKNVEVELDIQSQEEICLLTSRS